jgi:hypothetical protein
VDKTTQIAWKVLENPGILFAVLLENAVRYFMCMLTLS